MIRYLRKRHHVGGPSKQFLYLKKGTPSGRNQQRRPRNRESRREFDEAGEIRHLHHDRRVRLHRPPRQPREATHGASSPLLSPAAFLLQAEEPRTGDCRGKGWSQRSKETNQRTAASPKNPWKKIGGGLKEFPRDNNLWGSPADPELAHQPFSSRPNSQVSCPNKPTSKV